MMPGLKLVDFGSLLVTKNDAFIHFRFSFSLNSLFGRLALWQ
jgi:hypothetical protein